MNAKVKPEPIVQEIFSDTATQYLIQQELQDIYDSLEIINKEPVIIYMPEEELEALEEPKQDNKFQEESVYEDL